MAPRDIMARNKISTTVYITEEQDQKLKELSRRTKVPVAVYVREGIDVVIRQYGDVLPGQLSLPRPRGE
jgi:predicted DNA-binding protein